MHARYGTPTWAGLQSQNVLLVPLLVTLPPLLATACCSNGGRPAACAAAPTHKKILQVVLPALLAGLSLLIQQAIYLTDTKQRIYPRRLPVLHSTADDPRRINSSEPPATT